MYELTCHGPHIACPPMTCAQGVASSGSNGGNRAGTAERLYASSRAISLFTTSG